MEKIKTRFTSLDVSEAVRELQRTGLVGCHLQNIYDIANKTLLFKFTKKDAKVLLLLEAGVRVHSTRLDRENPNVLPSSFAAKLRKHLRERRLTKFEQLGFDRVVHFEFGHDSRPEATFHLFLELYSLGNIILTDHTYKVQSLVREVKAKDKETGVEIKQLAVGMSFDHENFQSLQSCPSAGEATKKLLTSRESAKNAMKSCFPLFTPAMIDYCLRVAGMEPKSGIDQSKLPLLLSAASDLIFNKLGDGCATDFGGVIKCHGETFIDFYPKLLSTDEECEPSSAIKTFTSFNEAVDEYYFQFGVRQAATQQQQQESVINKKFETIRKEQESRIQSLQNSIDASLQKAQIIEANIKLVEDATLVINTGLRNDLSWKDLELLIDAEKEKGRPTALLIERLRLSSSLADLRLPSGPPGTVIIDVDIRLGGHANANRHYEMRKAAMDKLERTKTAFAQAMKSAEAKVRADSRKDRHRTQHQHLIPKRRAFWFEKFNWFISSDSFLVLSGKDMHQNEYLVKRLLRDGDAYVHADLTGASSVIVKNHRKHPPTSSTQEDNYAVPSIPHRTLLEAGAFSLCFSKAWEAKIVTSAWWVHATQVSKTAPSGEYLGTGSFMIRGKKNFLPPAQLALSFGFMFVLDEESSARRRQVRVEREAQRDAMGDAAATADIASLDEREAKYISLINNADDDDDKVETSIDSIAKLDLVKERPKKEQPQQSSPKKSHPSTEEQKAKKKGPVRGKHGKEKKIKEKYKDQDEEEREMRLELLGSRSRSAAVPREQSKPVTKTEKPKSAQPKPQAETSLLEDNYDDEDTSGGMGELAVIDSLTGVPSATDVITGILVVAAPFMVMQHYKYRVKLLPGNLKRGTAAKTSLSLIIAENRATITEQERALIKSIPDADLNSTMPAKVRIAGSGVELSKIKKSQKSKKK